MMNLPSSLMTMKARRVTLDLSRLIADGQVTPEEAYRLETIGEPSGLKKLITNALLVFGAIMVVAGVLALQPPLDVGLGLALVATLAGSYFIFRRAEDWGFFGQTLILMGILGIGGWAALRFEAFGAPWPDLAWPMIALLMTASAVLFRNGVLAVLVPLALGSAIGGGTGYWHASYAIFMEEPTISIALFGLLAAALFNFRLRLPEGFQPIALLSARTSFFLANFGFWIGSLWGDYPGETFVNSATDWEAHEAWRQSAFFVESSAFSFAWAVFLIGAIILGVRSGRRFVANTGLVFLGIHFYTQLFETLSGEPVVLVLGGVALIVSGVGIVRFNKWLDKVHDEDPEAIVAAAGKVISMAGRDVIKLTPSPSL